MTGDTLGHESEPSSVTRELARTARRTRYQASRARVRRLRTVSLAIISALAVLAAGWWLSSPAGVASSDATTDSGSATVELTAAPAPPTPIFARYGSLDLHLVVAEADLTEIGYHQAARDNALPMESYLPDADLAAADESRGTGRVAAEVDPAATETRILGGTVLRMWRSNRGGEPDTAADIGAPPGSTVFSPVSGTIIEIRPYKLYGKYEDFEIHIQPRGVSDIDLVIIHVTDISVSVGELVTAGVTPLAKVRMLSDRIDHQLGEYTIDAGDHVHMQLNRIEAPGRTEPPNGS